MWFRWFALTIVAAAQEAPPIRVTVRLVQVDAVVTDSKGKRVTGLTKDDFEIKQNGKERPITAFAYVPEQTAEAPLVNGPVKPSEVKRTIAIVVDDLALSFSSTVRVRDALKKYATTAMRHGDLVSLIRTGGGVAVLEQFSTGPRHLLAAAELLKWRYAGRTGIKPIDPVDDDPAPANNGPRMLDHDMGLHELGAIATLDNVLAGMKKLPGRKSIVFISDALNMQFNTSASFERIVDKANRGAVSIYSIDPRGLRTKFPGAAEDSEDRLFGSLGDALGAAAYGENEGLHYLATRTGGLLFADNDIPGAIDRAAKDQLGYYLVGFSPADDTFDGAIPKFHKVTVRVKRPGLRVRWKSGFLGALDDQPVDLSATEEKSREQELLEALASPFRADSLHVRLTSSFVHSTQHGQGVVSQLHFDAKQLSFHRGLDGMWSAKVDIVTSAYRGPKHPLRQRERVENIKLPDEIYQKSLREGFLFQFFDSIPDPGFFMLRAVVRDSESRKIGSASQVLEVPDARKKKLAMSGIGVRLLPPGFGGVPLEPGFSLDVQPWTGGNPAVRRFKPGQDILYAFSVINPRPAMTTQLKVYRNGKLIFTGGQLQLISGGMIDATHHAGGGVIRLGSNFAPGEYLAQVTLHDPKAKKRAPRPSQWIDFEVVAGR